MARKKRQELSKRQDIKARLEELEHETLDVINDMKKYWAEADKEIAALRAGKTGDRAWTKINSWRQETGAA